MNLNIKKDTIDNFENKVLLGNESQLLKCPYLTEEQLIYLQENLSDKDFFHFDMLNKHIFIFKISEKKPHWRVLDNLRKAGNTLKSKVSLHKIEKIGLNALQSESADVIAFMEGFLLSLYDFNKYKKEKKEICLSTFAVEADNLTNDSIQELENVVYAVGVVKDMVNEPANALNALQLAEIAQKEGLAAGINVSVKGKDWIVNQGMGGLLAVNKGSVDQPTFTIMEYKPTESKNAKPIVLVGKGIVYDTGGLSLKTSQYMETMKADMGGAAAVIGMMIAAARNKMPLWIKAYIPATDNRPGLNAYAPGDVVTMHNGLTVEVLNTDAEGRMILADALSYAKADDPLLVVDVATLTGAAQAAVGEHAVVTMGTATDETFSELEKAGYSACERVVRFPFWDEYDELIKSSIADLKNVGGPVAGAITAGKFLEHFIDYPWIHLDISGSAFITSQGNYRGIGATGFGVRLLHSFLKQTSMF